MDSGTASEMWRFFLFSQFRNSVWENPEHYINEDEIDKAKARLIGRHDIIDYIQELPVQEKEICFFTAFQNSSLNASFVLRGCKMHHW